MSGIRWGKKLGKREETGTEPWKYYARLTDRGAPSRSERNRTCGNEKRIPSPPKPRDSGWHIQNVGTDLNGRRLGVAASVSSTADGGHETRTIPLVQRGPAPKEWSLPPFWGRPEPGILGCLARTKI
jgi:hypothetical protein